MLPRRPGTGDSWPWNLFRPPASPDAAADAPAESVRPSGAGVKKPFVERVPDVEPRLRRFTEKVSLIFNSLLGNGSIAQTSPGNFEIDPSAVSGAGGATGDGRTPGHYGL